MYPQDPTWEALINLKLSGCCRELPTGEQVQIVGMSKQNGYFKTTRDTPRLLCLSLEKAHDSCTLGSVTLPWCGIWEPRVEESCAQWLHYYYCSFCFFFLFSGNYVALQTLVLPASTEHCFHPRTNEGCFFHCLDCVGKDLEILFSREYAYKLRLYHQSQGKLRGKRKVQVCDDRYFWWLILPWHTMAVRRSIQISSRYAQ